MTPSFSALRSVRDAGRAEGPYGRSAGLEEPRKAAAVEEKGLHGTSAGGFGGQRAHVVQIGLGTFATVVQNLAGEPHEWDPVIAWLLEAVSETRAESLRVVAVEPVLEHVQRLRRLASKLPEVRLVQAAISDRGEQDTKVHVLSAAAFDALLSSAPTDMRSALEMDLTYIRNMSCVGGEHPTLPLCRMRAMQNYGIDVCLEWYTTQVWTFERLARELDFCGCEVLLVDAEGHDAKILRSMMDHCRLQEAAGRMAWPDIIVFESAGICDHYEGSDVEVDVVRQLDLHGYSSERLHRVRL